MKHTAWLVLLSFFLISCSKEIKIVKKPPTGEITSSNLFGIFTTKEGESEGPGFDPISLEQEKFYSLSTSGQEQELELEDGSKVENARLDSFINTKSGLILGFRFEPEDENSESQYKIFKLKNGKVLQLLDSDNRIRQDYREANEGYKQVFANKTYFCTEKGIMKWNDENQSLTNVKSLSGDSVCRGNQLEDEFYFMTQENIEESRYAEIGRIKSDGSIELIEAGNVAEGDNLDVYSFTKIGNKVLFIFDFYNGDIEEYEISVLQFNKDTSELQSIYERVREEGEYYVSISFYKRGKLFDGKVIIQVMSGIAIEPYDVLIEGDLLYTTYSSNKQEVLSYDGEELELISSPEPEPLVYYELVNSQDRLFSLKSKVVYYYAENLAVTSYTQLQLVDLDLNLVHDFNSNAESYGQLYDIQGNNVVAVYTSQEDNSQKVTVYNLPTSTQGIMADSRFTDQLYRRIYFFNFYDKVLFEATRSDVESRETVTGFFDLDGVIQLINKIKASIGFFDT